MITQRLAFSLPFLLLALVAGAQTPGTGNLAGAELALWTAVDGGAPDAADKPLDLLSPASVIVASPDGSLVGAGFALAAGLAPAGSDPVADFGTESGVLGLPLLDFAVLIDGLGGPGLGISIAPGGTVFGLTLPCVDFAAASRDGVYLQAAAPDATKPQGFVFSPATELVARSRVVTEVGASLGNDDSRLYRLCLGAVSFYGITYSELWIGSNGFVSFDGADADFTPTEAELLAQGPRVCGLWTDLAPDQGGAVRITERPGDLVVAFEEVPSAPAGAMSGLSSFDIGLTAAGDVDLSWGALDPDAPNANNDELVGISPGGGIEGLNEVDLSTVAAASSGLGGALYEVFDDDGACGEDARDLAGAAGTFAWDGAVYTWTGSGFQPLPPSLAGISPDMGPPTGGTVITVSGCGFSAGASYLVDFGGQSVPATVIDDRTLSCASPAGSAVVDVSLFENGALVGWLVNGFIYRTPTGG